MKAETEEKLEAKLFELSLETAKAPDVITIYRAGSMVVAWLRVETRHLQFSTKVENKITKKKTKKKVK